MVMLLVLGLVVMVEVLVCMKIMVVVVSVVGEVVSVGYYGDVVGVGNVDVFDNGGSVGDDGGSYFGVDYGGCVVGDVY